MMLKKFVAAFICGVGICGSANALVMSDTVSDTSAGTYELDRFDPSLGTLTDVALEVSAAYFAAEFFSDGGTTTVSVRVDFPAGISLFDGGSDTCFTQDCLTSASALIVQTVHPAASDFSLFSGAGTFLFSVSTNNADYGDFGVTVRYTYDEPLTPTSPVPLPAGVLLLGAGLGALGLVRARRR